MEDPVGTQDEGKETVQRIIALDQARNHSGRGQAGRLEKEVCQFEDLLLTVAGLAAESEVERERETAPCVLPLTETAKRKEK